MCTSRSFYLEMNLQNVLVIKRMFVESDDIMIRVQN